MISSTAARIADRTETRPPPNPIAIESMKPLIGTSQPRMFRAASVQPITAAVRDQNGSPMKVVRSRMMAQAPIRLAPSRTQKDSFPVCCSVSRIADNRSQASAGPMTGTKKRMARVLYFSSAPRLNTRATKAATGRRSAKPISSAAMMAAACTPNSMLNASPSSHCQSETIRSRHASGSLSASRSGASISGGGGGVSGVMSQPIARLSDYGAFPFPVEGVAGRVSDLRAARPGPAWPG